jgi:hypothetical protein
MEGSTEKNLSLRAAIQCAALGNTNAKVDKPYSG